MPPLSRIKTPGEIALAVLIAILAAAVSNAQSAGLPGDNDLKVVASFAEKSLMSPLEQIELVLNRPLIGPSERIAVLIGTTDVSSLFTQAKQRFRYNPKLWPLPPGESTVTVYVVSNDNDWKEIARFVLRVADKLEQSPADITPAKRFVRARFSGPFDLQSDENVTAATESDDGQQPAASSSNDRAATKQTRRIKFTQSLTLSVPSQPAQSTFPGPQPERSTFIELNLQASIKNEATYGIFSTQSSFDFAGSSFHQEALRFGTLGKDAPHVDLSSYLIHFQTGKVKYDVGHFSYGSQRQLISGFSSRGIQITVPFLRRFDFSAAAMNGTQLVGYGNFFGLSKRTHQMLSGSLGVEFIRKRPGGLRLEVGALNAYFQPISGVNRGVVTDVQRSRGLALRLIASDKAGRFHFEGGFTRSFFASPSDTSLNQGANVVALPNLTRNAHYLEASYDILKDHALTKTKKANLSVAFREENVAPLFRSLGASTQADKIQYELSVSGSVNDITAQFSHVNFHDNLRRIPSILRTLNGSTHVSLAAPASSLLNLTKSSPWLPRLGYSFDRNHSFGAVIPVNGGFEIDLSSIPNLFGTNQSFSADWQVKKFTWGYNINHSYQDNRQRGREAADQGVLVNTGRVGIAVNRKLNLNIDLSAESSVNIETGRIDRTLRLGPAVTWQLSKHMGVAANFSNTIAGDAANTSHNRNSEFDCSWTYRFERGNEGLRKMAGQFFIRYANHYSHSIELISISDSLRKNQTLTANFGITFF